MKKSPGYQLICLSRTRGLRLGIFIFFLGHYLLFQPAGSQGPECGFQPSRHLIDSPIYSSFTGIEQEARKSEAFSPGGILVPVDGFKMLVVLSWTRAEWIYVLRRASKWYGGDSYADALRPPFDPIPIVLRKLII